MRVGTWALAVALATGWSATGSAQAAAAACGQNITRRDVVPCALAASAALLAEREGSAALRGRQRAVRSVLPSNPTASFSGGHRKSDQQSATNWYGTLAQEVEIGGQRRARRSAVASEQRAQQAATLAAEREVAAAALSAYFEVLAARDALALAETMEQSFAAAGAATRSAAEHGAGAGIDADLADLSTVTLTRARLEAERRHRAALAELAVRLGLEPGVASLSVEGELVPLAALDGSAEQLATQAVEQRPEVERAAATSASFSSWADVQRRSRAPNLTVSVFAQRDGFDERVLGAGVALPITLPAPLGHDFSGEAAENEALARRAGALLQQTRRDIQLDVVQAYQARDAAAAALALYTPERLERARQSLAAIQHEIGAGRLGLSTMIVPQQTLIAFLHDHVAARLAMCLASVELARSAGLSFEGAMP
jgi:cobalt-zinc-cadmium efflux system outer membrane protein